MPPSFGVNLAITNVVNSFKLASSPPALVLDSLSAGAAYSASRKLRTAYTGAAFRVRRSSDNVEQDIGFSGNAVDTAALTSFIGSNSGFVVTWYDQSGNARHVTNATAAQQPRIVNAGTIDTRNSVQSLLFNGTSHRLFNSSPFMYAAGAATVCMVAEGGSGGDRWLITEDRVASGNPTYVPLGEQTSNPDMFAFLRNDAGTQIINRFLGPGPDGFTGVLSQYLARDTGSSMLRGVNGTTFSSSYTRSGTLTLDRFCIGGADSGLNLFSGYISEVIVFAASLANSDVNTVALNQGSAFGITVNPI